MCCSIKVFFFLNAVGAAVFTESLFKGGSAKGENFLHQQFWKVTFDIFGQVPVL